MTVPSGTTQYSYDSLNRLVSVTDPDNSITSYTYDNVGNRASVTYPNGNITEYEYDTLNRLTYLGNRKSDGVIISNFTYTLEPAGNRTRVVENTGRIVNYTYDDVYRLKEEAITDLVLGSKTITYTYDAFGNRLTKTDSAGTVVYSYDDNDRLTAEAGPGYTHTYAYDNNGNNISKTDGASSTGYAYDFKNRLILIDTNAVDTAYGYDSDGIRISSNAGGDVTNYLVDKNRDYAQVLEERNAVGTINVEYVYGDDLISQERGGGDFYYLYDGQMSTRQLTDDTEDAVNTYIYDAFGVLIDQTGVVANNYMYTGEQYDPNAGFYYLRARYMNPEIRRFVTVDPFEGVSFEPATLHKYIYAADNPLMNIDPSGEMALLIEQMVVVGQQDKERKDEVKIKTEQGRRAIKKLKCTAGKVSLTKIPGLVGHHSFQKSISDVDDQVLVFMEKIVHQVFHQVFGYELVAANLPNSSNYSRTAWQQLFKKYPGKQIAVAEVLVRVSDIVDNKCKYHGVLTNQVKNEIWNHWGVKVP